jgi:large subunit ribosomal protein L35
MLQHKRTAARLGANAPDRSLPAGFTPATRKESKMPKMKTKSGAKKRFRFTATGKVKAGAAGKRHGMIKRTAKFVQKARGTMVLNDSDAGIVKKYMPYNR